MTDHDHSRRRSLSDIARGRVDDLRRVWVQTEAIAGYDPLPRGVYRCLVASGEFTSSRSNNTPGYKLTLQVLDGEHRGRLLWHDIWFTADAMGRAKYDLQQIGITDLDQLEMPLPQGRIVTVEVSLRTGDDGIQFNKVRGLKGVPEQAAIDEFAPPPEPGIDPTQATIPGVPTG